jgi:hypothetical protein
VSTNGNVAYEAERQVCSADYGHPIGAFRQAATDSVEPQRVVALVHDAAVGRPPRIVRAHLRVNFLGFRPARRASPRRGECGPKGNDGRTGKKEPPRPIDEPRLTNGLKTPQASDELLWQLTRVAPA